MLITNSDHQEVRAPYIQSTPLDVSYIRFSSLQMDFI